MPPTRAERLRAAAGRTLGFVAFFVIAGGFILAGMLIALALVEIAFAHG